MFYYLEGKLAHSEPNMAVIDCGGVGYLCHVSTMTQANLKLGEKCRIYTYLYVREDAMDLYGFHTVDEKNCFLLLTGISGVGMKAGLSILSTLSPEKFALAVLSDDEKALTQAPGVGKKLAQRIILELKDKLKKQYGSDKLSGIDIGVQNENISSLDTTGEALMALQVLGYSSAEASSALRGADTAASSVEELIRYALKNLAKG